MIGEAGRALPFFAGVRPVMHGVFEGSALIRRSKARFRVLSKLAQAGR